MPKGVDAELFRPTGANLRQALGLADRRIVLSVGRFVPIKNMALLIEALAKMAPADPSLHLLLVGEGPELQSLKEQAARLDVTRAVTFAGYVPQAEMAPYYHTADLFALGSDFDNSPNVVLEAMACGLPVVATEVGGVAEYVAPRGGALVPRRDAMAMAGMLGDWMSSVERRRAAGAFNRQRVLQEFSWRASASRLLDVYRAVLADREQMKATA